MIGQWYWDLTTDWLVFQEFERRYTRNILDKNYSPEKTIFLMRQIFLCKYSIKSLIENAMIFGLFSSFTY